MKCSNAPKGKSIAYTIGDRGGVQWIGFSPMTADDLTAVVKRKEKGIPYENEPLVKVFSLLPTGPAAVFGATPTSRAKALRFWDSRPTLILTTCGNALIVA